MPLDYICFILIRFLDVLAGKMQFVQNITKKWKNRLKIINVDYYLHLNKHKS